MEPDDRAEGVGDFGAKRFMLERPAVLSERTLRRVPEPRVSTAGSLHTITLRRATRRASWHQITNRANDATQVPGATGTRGT